MTKTVLIGFTVVVLAAGTIARAQERRVASPPGGSATQIGGIYDVRTGYVAGKWLELRYGRPLKRGRDLFGTADYVDFLNDGAPVWRAGANQTTRLITEAAIVVGDKTLAPGEYTVFIDLQPDAWMLVLSTWPAQTTYSDANKQALWGAYDYTPDRDVVRVRMTRETLPYSFDQLSWEFLNVTPTGGRLAMIWDTQIAWVPFTIKN